MCCSSPSPLDMLETTFRLLATGPHPLALDGPSVGLRAGLIGLWDLRAMVCHPATSASVQRAVLVELVRRARRYRGAWVVGVVGVVLLGLAPPAGPTAGHACGITDLAQKCTARRLPSDCFGPWCDLLPTRSALPTPELT